MDFNLGIVFGFKYFVFVIIYLFLNGVLIRRRWYVVEFESVGFCFGEMWV